MFFKCAPHLEKGKEGKDKNIPFSLMIFIHLIDPSVTHDCSHQIIWQFQVFQHFSTFSKHGPEKKKQEKLYIMYIP